MPLKQLRRDGLRTLGSRELELVQLLDERVSVADGLIVSMSTARPAERLETAIRTALDESPLVTVRALLPEGIAAEQFERRAAHAVDFEDQDADLSAKVVRLVKELEAPELAFALGSSGAAVRMVVAPRDKGSFGWAASVEPLRSNPDEVSVWGVASPAAPWLVERRSGRIVTHGEGLQPRLVEQAADLADRAQLALGRPVKIEWIVSGGKVSVLSVRSVRLAPTFMSSVLRRVDLMGCDEGTMAPLTLDTMERAFRAPESRTRGTPFRTIYGRPYRSIPRNQRVGRRRRWRSGVREGVAFSRLATRASTLRQQAKAYGKQSQQRLQALHASYLASARREETALALLSDIQGVVADGFFLLFGFGDLSVAAVSMLERAGITISAPEAEVLVSPRAVRSRRQLHARMVHCTREWALAGSNAELREWPLADPQQWREIRQSLRNARPLGVDVRVPAFGDSDESLIEAFGLLSSWDPSTRERTRRDTIARLRVSHRARLGSPMRQVRVGMLLAILKEIGLARGVVGEALSRALLAFRQQALDVGARLVNRVELDQPSDVFYLRVSELRDLAAGTPGTYASRIRSRREDDRRWRNYRAPRRLGR